jgi:dynein heavy chain
LETNETYNEGFRVWITTEPHEKFPINLLQMAIKVTDDPPTGIKAGLRKSYAWITQQMLEQVDTVEWRKLLYTTCFFHSTVIERKKYGPLGWCVPYEFNQSDLECSIHFLMKYLYETEKSKISWDTIRYMICDVQYGGRVTDTFDKVLLDCYGKKWYNSSIFSKEFEFYKNYGIPDSKKIEHYREYIEQLPMFDTPEVFGMHSNAELTFNSATAAYDLGTIMDIQPKQSSGSGGETRESKVLNICKAHLAKLPPDFNLVKVRKQCKKMGLDPLTIFLRQEIDRIQVVISLIRKTLTELQLAIAGTIIMSSELQDALNALYDARVPEKWIKVSWESPTLGYWFSDVLQRIQQYTSWLENGPPKVFWISGFFNTAGFLTAMKQQSTRAHPGWSLETVSLKTEVTKKEKDQIVVGDGEEGVYVYGLFLEGAAWDKRSSKLVDAKPKNLMNPLPVIHITAVNSVQSDEMSRMYICPVYKLPRRTALNYIFNLTLNTDEDPSVWTLRGVAALCSKM